MSERFELGNPGYRSCVPCFRIISSPPQHPLPHLLQFPILVRVRRTPRVEVRSRGLRGQVFGEFGESGGVRIVLIQNLRFVENGVGFRNVAGVCERTRQ